MKKISKSTFFMKLQTFIVFGFLGIMTIIITLLLIVFPVMTGEEVSIKAFLILIILAVFIFSIYFQYKKIVWPLVDAVYDEGHQLKFKKGKKEQCVRFEDISGINFDKYCRTLEIITNSKGDIGTELCFLLPTHMKSLLSAEKHPLYLDLMNRLESAKTK